MNDVITLDYGSGGKKTDELIRNLILKHLGNEVLSPLPDAAVIEGAGKLVFSTDSFVVDPVFFPGGDIGKLCVCGTVNDIAVSGGRAKVLSLALIIEEGFLISDLEKILSSVAQTARSAGVLIVTGDTKVVERGKGDGIYINTAGIGFLQAEGLSPERMEEGDAVILSGPAGEHGTAVLLARNKLLRSDGLRSDCAPVHTLAEKLMTLGEKLKVMRDPTRGGVATVLCEFTEDKQTGIELDQSRIPVKAQVGAACEILGLDPLYCACEGRLVAVVSKEAEAEALRLLQSDPAGKDSAVIGRVSKEYPGRVVLKTQYGSRILTKLTGDQLPRIC